MLQKILINRKCTHFLPTFKCDLALNYNDILAFLLLEEASLTPNIRASTVDKTSSSTTPSDANTSSTSTPNHSSIAVANVTMQEQNQQPEDGSEGKTYILLQIMHSDICVVWLKI